MKKIVNSVPALAATTLCAITISAAVFAASDKLPEAKTPFKRAKVTNTKTANDSDAAAKTRLVESAKVYTSLQGISMKYTDTLSVGGQKMTSSGVIAFSRPNQAKLTFQFGNDNHLTLSDGKKTYVEVQFDGDKKTVLTKENNTKGITDVMGQIRSVWGFVLQNLVSGRSLLAAEGMKGANVKMLPDGSIRFRAVFQNEYPVNLNFYIDPNYKLLRNVESTFEMGGQKIHSSVEFRDIKMNPEFAPDEFTFVPQPDVKVVTKMPKELARSENLYDPKIVVGALPFQLKGKDLNGKTYIWNQYKGKVVLLDFWATWCGPCVGELPNVLKNYKKYHAKGFEVISVSLDEDKKQLTDFVKARDLKFPTLFDGKGWKNIDAVNYKVQSIPFSLLIGKDGKIAAVNPRGRKLEAAIQRALTRN